MRLLKPALHPNGKAVLCLVGDGAGDGSPTRRFHTASIALDRILIASSAGEQLQDTQEEVDEIEVEIDGTKNVIIVSEHLSDHPGVVYDVEGENESADQGIDL